MSLSAHEDASQTLNVAAWLPASTANGPGRRFVIWLQGCPLHCLGCINPDFWPFEPRQLVTVSAMLDHILQVPGIEGLTYTGGEPMAQVAPLLALSRQVRAHGLSVISYSGYTHEQLLNRNDPTLVDLLECLDILIDGPYKREQQRPLMWRGSANQRVLFLTNRYAGWASLVDLPFREVEFFVGDQLTVTGLWEETLLARILGRMKE